MAQPDEQPPLPGSADTLDELALLLRRLRRREARQRRGAELTYRQLAARAGWSHTVVAAYLTGKTLPPIDRFDTLIQLLGATRVEQRALATARDRVEERRRGRATPAAAVAPAGTDRPVPRQLPSGVPGFIGRMDELATLDGLLRHRDHASSVVIAAVTGTGGVGKTAFALHWAHRVARQFPDGQLYANLRGSDPVRSPVDPADVLRGFLESLPSPPFRTPVDPEALAGRYRSLVAGRRMLVVLDDTRDAAQVAPLLPGTPGCLVVVTSRNPLLDLISTADARPVWLEPLSWSDAHCLLARRLGGDRLLAEPAAARTIIAGCGRLPRALATFAAHAATRPERSLVELARELRPMRPPSVPLPVRHAVTRAEHGA